MLNVSVGAKIAVCGMESVYLRDGRLMWERSKVFVACMCTQSHMYHKATLRKIAILCIITILCNNACFRPDYNIPFMLGDYLLQCLIFESPRQEYHLKN